MTNEKKYFSAMIFFICASMLSACTTYERQIVPFQLPEASPNAALFDGAVIAARSFTASEAKEAFGFDIVSAGIFPVQVSFDNKSEHSLTIIPEQTFLIDEQNNVWPILGQGMAYDRLAKKTELGKVIPEGAKSGLLLGAAGAVIGAAIGIVTGTNVGEAVGKGAAIGTAAGLTVGGAQGTDNTDVRSQIKEDLQSRSLHARAIKKGELAYGFIFYPGEVKTAKVLRLQLRANETGKISTFNMQLQK
jgi:hypothetical protein